MLETRIQLFAIAMAVFAMACSKSSDRDTPFPSASARTPRGVAEDSCLAQDRWTLGSVALGQPVEQAVAAVGAPSTTARDSSEDDGGVYEFTTYRFDAVEFEVVRGVIDRVRTTSPSLKTSWGIHVGLSRDSVARLLATYGIRVPGAPDTLDIADCGAPSAYLTLVFDGSDRVRAVELAAERP